MYFITSIITAGYHGNHQIYGYRLKSTTSDYNYQASNWLLLVIGPVTSNKVSLQPI